jgi:hypothetical protein
MRTEAQKQNNLLPARLAGLIAGWVVANAKSGSSISPIERGIMAVITKIAPDIYRISIFAPSADLQVNHFLVNDDEPLLFQGENGVLGLIL